MLVKYHSIHYHRYYGKTGGLPSLLNKFMYYHNKIPLWAAEIAFFSYSSGSWKSKMKVPEDTVPGQGCFWCADGHLLVISSHGFPLVCEHEEREKDLIRTLTP